MTIHGGHQCRLQRAHRTRIRPWRGRLNRKAELTALSAWLRHRMRWPRASLLGNSRCEMTLAEPKTTACATYLAQIPARIGWNDDQAFTTLPIMDASRGILKRRIGCPEAGWGTSVNSVASCWHQQQPYPCWCHMK